MASVSIGIGAYIIYERGYSVNDLGKDIEKILDGDDLELDLGNLKSISFEEKYILTGKEIISLEAKMGDVLVVPYDGDDLILTIQGEVAEKYHQNYIEIKETSNEIHFSLFDRMKSQSFFQRNSNNLVVTLKIPLKYQKNLALTTVFSEIEIIDVNLASLTVTSISGDVEVQGGIQDELVFELVSGDINVDSEVLQIKGETVSGDVSLKKIRGFTIDTISGDLEVVLTDEPLKSQGETVSGNLTIEILGNMEISYDFETVSGDITIETFGSELTLGKSAKNKGLNENIVKASTVSGDITLKN